MAEEVTAIQTLINNIIDARNEINEHLVGMKVKAAKVGSDIATTAAAVKSLRYREGYIYSTEPGEIGQWSDGVPMYKTTFTTYPGDEYWVTDDTTTRYGKNCVEYSKEFSLDPIETSKVKMITGLLVLEDNTMVELDRPISDEVYSLIAVKGEKFYLCLSKALYDNVKTIYINVFHVLIESTSNANDYSTDSQVIGTWIGGAKLYSKTIVADLSEASSWTAKDYVYTEPGFAKSQLVDATGYYTVKPSSFETFMDGVSPNNIKEVYAIIRYAPDGETMVTRQLPYYEVNSPDDKFQTYAMLHFDADTGLNLIASQKLYGQRTYMSAIITIKYTTSTMSI